MKTRLSLGVLLFSLGFGLTSPSAQAHAVLSSSSPAAGASMDAAPAAITLNFTEPPDISISSVRVIDARGANRERGRPRVIPGQPTTMTVGVESLDRGVYTVSWRVTSTADGHTTAGSYAFGVGVEPSAVSGAAAPRSTRTPPPSPLSVGGRWALYAAMVVLVGAATLTLLLGLPTTVPRTWPLTAWLLGAVGLSAMVLDQRIRADVSLSALLTSSTGDKVMREIAAVGIVLVAAIVATARPRRWSVLTLGTSAAVVLMARAAAGHAGAASIPWLAIGVQTVHMVGVGVWIGTLAWLAWLLRTRGVVEQHRALRRFSTLASGALAVVVATGTLRALAEVGVWGRLTSTSFGQTLIVKVGLVAIVVALGVRNRRRYARSASFRPASRSLAFEAGVGVAVLVATGVLSGLPPSASLAAADKATPRLVVNGVDYATTIRVRLTIRPGTVGPNSFDAEILDYDSREPLDARRVTLRLTSERTDVAPSTLALRRTSAGRWRGDGPQLAFPGRWRVTAAVERRDGTVEVPMVLRTRTPPQRITAQRTPGLPTIYTITTGTGEQVQGYVDPGSVGSNEVHVTFMAEGGIERAVTSVEMRSTPPSGGSRLLEPRRLSQGHFVASTELGRGRWTFSFDGVAEDGTSIQGRFADVVR